MRASGQAVWRTPASRSAVFHLPRSAAEAISWGAALIFVACAPTPAHALSDEAAVDLYVAPEGSDANSGTPAAPFRSILAASQVAQPGTTRHVAPGMYAGGL